MEALRKLSSIGRSKESKEAAKMADPEQLLNGGGAHNVVDNNETVGPSPPRARVSDDVEDEAEAGVEVAGEDDGYDSAVEKMGTSSTPSVVEEVVQAPKDAEVQPMSFAQALRKDDDESQKEEEIETTEEGKDNGDGPRESSSSSAEEESSSSSSSSSSAEEEEEGTVSRQVSIRAMPVAKLTTENEEQEEEVDEDDGNRNGAH